MAADLDYNQILAQLSVDFCDRTADVIQDFYRTLDRFEENGIKKNAAEEFQKTLFRETHTIKGSAGSVGYPTITMVCQRFEDYLLSIQSLNLEACADIRQYLDRISDIMDGMVSKDDASAAIRDMPRGLAFDVEAIEIHDVEVLMVMPKGTATTIVRRELEACGYSVTYVPCPFEAMEFAVRAKPDFIVVSPVLDSFDGVDFSRAIKAMVATEKVPVIMVTSLGRNSRQFENVPKDIPIIAKGGNFSDEFADTLQSLDLI